MQNNHFLELMQSFTNETLKGPIGKNEVFTELVKRIEFILNPKSNPKYRLHPDKFCPIASSGSNFGYVILGLNPHDDGEAGDTRHLKTWEALAEYHNPKNLEGDHIFNRVLGDPGAVVPYYRNLGLLMNSLEKRKFVSWSDFRKGSNNAKTKQKYLELISTKPMAVVELIPFASKEFSLSRDGLDELFRTEVCFKNYLVKLLNLILNESAKDAWIICNGKSASEAFIDILKIMDVNFETPVEIPREKKFSFHIIEGKKVLMLHEFLRRRGGVLNTNQQIKEMIEIVVKLSLSYKN